VGMTKRACGRSGVTGTRGQESKPIVSKRAKAAIT